MRILDARLSTAFEFDRVLKETLISENHSNCAYLIYPHSLSTIEIEVILANAVCNVDESSSFSLKSSTSQIDFKSGNTINLFPNSRKAYDRLASTCRSFVFDVCAALPLRYLENMRL